MTENLNKLEQKIGVKFKNKDLLIKSLIHKSHNSNDNNEKLEFLGDRVLGLILSQILLDSSLDVKLIDDLHDAREEFLKS